MATLGWLKVGIATDTSKFAKGLKGAAHALDSFKSTVIGIGATLGVAFGTKELIGWVSGAGAAIGETVTLGERVGLTAEAMGKLQYAARLSGVDGESFTSSLEKMNEKLGAVAIEGSGPAYESLKRFGLSARQVLGRGTEQAFFTLVDVLGKIKNPTERAEFAIAMFGKSGQEVINMAAQGSDALKALGVEAMVTGAALNSVDAEKVAESGLAMQKLGEFIGGVANQIVVQLAPLVTAAADQMIAWMQSGTKAGDFMSQAIDWVSKAIGGVIDVVQVLNSVWHLMQSAFDNAWSHMLAGIDAAIKGFGFLYEKITGIKLELTDVAAVMSVGLHDASLEEMTKALAPGKWGHQLAREFVDNARTGANERAVFNAAKAEKFAGAGTAIEHPKIRETQFAGAMTMGSKEAYSAVLKSRSMLVASTQNRIETNTRMTAEATTRAATALARMVAPGMGGALGREMMAAAGG